MTILSPNMRHVVRNDLHWFLKQSRPRRIRTMREFAESEIVIPDGPFVGRRFRCERQPYTGLWFDAVDSGRWSRCVATGPTQSGKTLTCFVIPMLYHLFELSETVICGVPDMDMAGDKWREDILPAIEQSRFRDLLPRRGGGSRGGRVESLQFGNGATLKFMSGGGSDKSRAGFTSRVVVITETDGMDQPGATSRESDKITQLEARTRAYGRRKRIYMECTVSTEQGRTWQEYLHGTRSRILLPCPHCAVWVTPEREHLVGWREAESQSEARATGRFGCPSCGEMWNDEERSEANQKGRIAHVGQSINAEGKLCGDPPAADTLGFRWSAVNNLFLTSGDVSADEWRAGRTPDEENAEREMCQFVWCLPVAPSKLEETSLVAHELMSRMMSLPRGIVPEDVEGLTAGVDIGKYLLHWIVVAWSPGPKAHIVDYGRIEVASEDLGVEQAIMVALREFKDLALSGWPKGTSKGEHTAPAQVWVDAGYMTPVVYAFCRESNKRFCPAIGRGAAQQHSQWYNRPKSTGSVVKHIGEGYHVSWLRTERLHLVEVDADHWKTWVHQRLSTPLESVGAISLFQTSPQEHLALAKHLTAEVKTEEFVAGKGVVVKWERLRRQNHWFDALYNASAAGHYCGVRLVKEQPVKRRPQRTLAEMAAQSKEGGLGDR
ncbi:MAG: phage terminase large subunit family protein [Planctomycetaceae bacterium]|nr:phage terminase large subunit family protein [Planctomycetales bacterium]MCB9924967.1 phage terminase large subunit family protein [Planctomycetaceae bacterium]